MSNAGPTASGIRLISGPASVHVPAENGAWSIASERPPAVEEEHTEGCEHDASVE